MKKHLSYVGGPLIKLHHASNEMLEFKSAKHMQCLHIVDSQLSVLSTVDEKYVSTGKVNSFIFETSETVHTNWGKSEFYCNFKNYIVNPVIQSLYNKTPPDSFFSSTKTGEVEPLSKAIFLEWLTR